MTDIIPATGIDYTNVDEICAYRLLLCKIYECEGGFNLPSKSNLTTREIRRQALIWLREVKALIDAIMQGSDFSVISGEANQSARSCSAQGEANQSAQGEANQSARSCPAQGEANQSARSCPVQGQRPCSLSSIPRLLSGYDILYRLAHGKPCHDYLREVKLRTADRWLKGDKSITRTDVVLLLLTEADRDIRTLEKRYSEYSIRVMTSWVDDLRMYGEFAGTPLAETYRRLSYLLNEDLFVHMGKKEENKVKSQWVSTHILSENRIDALDTETLWAYANFIDSIPFSGIQEYALKDTMYMHIMSKIATRPDTHPYTAKAIELTFKQQAELIA